MSGWEATRKNFQGDEWRVSNGERGMAGYKYEYKSKYTNNSIKSPQLTQFNKNLQHCQPQEQK